MTTAKKRVEVSPAVEGRGAEVFTAEALEFISDLQRRFNPRRLDLLRRRVERQTQVDRGKTLRFRSETRRIRDDSWNITPVPVDLIDRRVEITGPTDRKMMINALNSGAKTFMADFEDANTPAWRNVVEGQVNLRDAVRRTIEYASSEGKEYRLNREVATLLVRPRGWHLPERHVRVDREDASASLVDFGLFFFHNANDLVARGTAPYFYLPKMESHLEARLWNDVFAFAEEALGVRRGTTKATALIETFPAAFEMEEILFELRDHAAGLNAGRWDYLFSIIKTLRARTDFVLPDRAQLTMTVPFMRAYTELLVKTCHRRGAHAIGGMAAFVPSRKDPAANEVAFTKVREDKTREANDGFDGTWVAHPDLVPVTGTRSGWATHVPKKPSFASRVLSSRTFVNATSFAAGSLRLGTNAAMPPIAWAPRRWHVFTRSSVYARMNGTVIVSCARSGSTKSVRARSVLMMLNR